MQLFPYQITGAKFLAERGKALLADEMGLGKSAQAIEAVSLCEQNSNNDCPANWKVLIVSPASVVENWKREIARFGSPAFLWDVRSYDKAARGDVGQHDEWHVLILDEAHYLKNHKAKRTKAVFGEKCDGVGGLVERAKHVFCLTGTPMPNNASELWPMLRAVMPQTIPGRGKPLTYWGFVNRYCKTRDNGFGIQIVGTKNAGELKAALAPCVLRRKKDEVLTDLPPIRFDELALDGKIVLPQDCADEVKRVHAALEKDGFDGLKAIAPHVAQYRRLCGLAKVDSVVGWIKEQLEGGLEKLVVFAHHRDVLDAIESAFHLIDVSVCRINGSVSVDERQREVDRFQTQSTYPLFLGQIQAAGTGITLTAASDALFVESSWVPAENEQAAMRIHRIGQRNACLVRFATIAGSIDAQIQRAVMRKTQDIAKLFS